MYKRQHSNKFEYVSNVKVTVKEQKAKVMEGVKVKAEATKPTKPNETSDQMATEYDGYAAAAAAPRPRRRPRRGRGAAAARPPRLRFHRSAGR